MQGAGNGRMRPTLVVPVYNEGENLPGLVAAIERDIPEPVTVLLVYDFEEDTTLPVARRLAATRPWLRLVRNDLGRGPANAIRAGLLAAGLGPAIVVMADLSDDLSLVPAMVGLYERGYRIVCPSRYAPGGRQIGGPFVKRTLSRWAGRSLAALTGLPTRDATNSYRLYDAILARELDIQTRDGFQIGLEITVKAFRRGVPIAEIPCTWRDRTAGTSRFRLLRWLPRYLRWWLLALLPGKVPVRRPVPLSPGGAEERSAG